MDEACPIKHLHSYWRMDYVAAPKPLNKNEKLFLNLPKSQNDEETLILFRSKYSYIVLNKYPYNAGHLLVVPFREVTDLKDLSNEELSDLMQMIIKSQDILTQALQPQGFNIGFNIGEASGAGIPGHLHCHIVPRWKSDTNFMPVLTNTKVLPESLHNMWKRLREFTNVGSK